jgi:hypothetical protein
MEEIITTFVTFFAQRKPSIATYLEGYETSLADDA